MMPARIFEFVPSHPSNRNEASPFPAIGTEAKDFQSKTGFLNYAQKDGACLLPATCNPMEAYFMPVNKKREKNGRLAIFSLQIKTP
jgi:hypothetical protein